MNYDIFIDESGLFTETSNDPGDRIVEHKRSKKFPSQLAGIIVREGSLSPDDAWRVFKPACEEINFAVTDEFHSTDLKRIGGGLFDRLVIATCRYLERDAIQPFRIVNRERVSFGDRKANYANMVGELLVRICKELDRGDDGTIVLNIYQAGIKNTEYESGSLPFWEHDDFEPTLKAVFQRASISAGWAKDSAKWQLGPFRFRSGKRDERLWLCDLVSNASHDDFQTVNEQSAFALKDVLGRYDFSLSFDTTLHQVRELCEREAHGIALTQLLEGILSPWVGKEAKGAYTDEFDRTVEGMFQLPPLARTPQLQTLLGWFHQTADDRSRVVEAKIACKWIDERLKTRYERSVHLKDPTLIAWLRLSISTAWLTACNHSADLDQGRMCSETIEKLIPEIAGRWEYASDLMRALVVQAVHLNDCFEHQDVCQKMDLVSNYYCTLGGLFRDAYEDVFPGTVRSKVCGEALGTKVQSQIFLLLGGSISANEVRNTSEQAIEQFADDHDRQRQYQYRSEIESIEGQWQAAREYLAKGIGFDKSDHDSVGQYIAGLSDNDRFFPLLHWTRIGGMAAAAGDESELESFFAAWRKSNLDAFIQRDLSTYPAHGILRRMAVVYAATGDFSKTTETLRSLRAVVQPNSTPLFQLIEVAGMLQAAGIAGRTDVRQMEHILAGGKNDPSVKKLIRRLLDNTSTTQARIAEITSQFLRLVESGPTSERLILDARIVGY